ncbi:hypothetical protein Tco_1108761 [Tanacetum coccineum]
MAREAEVKRVVNTGNGVVKPVWTNANMINHANKLIPRSVQLNTGRTNINSVRPKVNSVRPKVNPVRPKVNAVSPKDNTVRPRQPITHKTSNSMSPKRPQMNQINQRMDFSKSYSSTFSKVIIGELKNDYLNNNIGPTFIRTENANVPQADPSLQRPSKQGDQSKDFEEFKDKGDLLPFGGIKGYISGKGRIRSRFYELNALSMEKQANPHAVCFKSNKQCRLLKKKLNQGHLHTNQRKRRTLTEPPKRDERILYYPLEDNPKIQAFRSRLEESPKAFRDSPENNTTSTLQLILVVRQLILEVPKKDVLKLYSHARRTVTAQATQVWVLEILPHGMNLNAFDEKQFQMSSWGNSQFFLVYQSYITRWNTSSLKTRRAEILNQILIWLNVKAAITPMETKVPLTKDEESFDVDVTPKTFSISMLSKDSLSISRATNLGLWYPRESPFDLEAFSDSDYGGSNLDRKSTTGGCQFLGQRLISWQCKKQTIMATSTTI